MLQLFYNLTTSIGPQPKRSCDKQCRRRTILMDPGTVVWLPGSGYDGNDACIETYGGNYYDCGEMPWDGGILVTCCPWG